MKHNSQRHRNWWSYGDLGMVHELVVPHIEGIMHDQERFHQNNARYARLYSNRDEIGLGFGGTQFDALESREYITDNVVKSVIDTASSIIAKNRPKVRVLTNGAEWDDQLKARDLEKFVYAEMKSNEMYRLAPLVFRDASIFGTGVIHVCAKNDRVRLERVLIDEIIVDEREAIYGCTKEVHRRVLVPKDQLIADFPEYSEEIHRYAQNNNQSSGLRDDPPELIPVYYSWRLPSGDSPGLECATMDGVTFYAEEWDHDWLPFVFFHWEPPLTGFYGLSLARDLHPYQNRLNELNRFIRRCQDLIAVPRVFIDAASKVLKLQIDNKIGAIIPYRGKPPTFFTPQAITAEIYNYREQIKRDAFQFAGISQMSAQSLKPAGLDSAVALREFNDIENQRFVIQAQRYEQFFLDVGMAMIKMAKITYRRGHKVMFTDRDFVHEIHWEDVDLDEDRFCLDIQAASILSMTPSGRLQAVIELAQVGQLDKSEIRYLLNHPDLERTANFANADYEDAQKTVDMLMRGEWVTPEPFQNLELLSKLVQKAILFAKSRNAPTSIMANLQEFELQVKDLSQNMAQQGVVEAGPMGTAEPPIGAAGVAGGEMVQGLPLPITNQ